MKKLNSELGKTFLIAALTVLLITVFSTAVASAADIYVNQTGWWPASGTFNASGTPIQHAIDYATAGNTIYVYNGSYTENVDVDKQLTLQGEDAGVVTVNAKSTGDHVFEVTVDYVNISGFTVSGATIYPMAGIYLSGRQHCNISDNTASNNNYGILLSHSSNNTLTCNTANTNNWYGIRLYKSSNNTFSGNIANTNNHDGIYLDYSCNYNTLTSNTANSNSETGIYLDYSCNYNTLTRNIANLNSENGIRLYKSSNNTFSGNTANSNYYGILLVDSCNYNTLTSNIANSNNYGILLGDSCNYNTLTSNTANSNNDNGIGVCYSSNYNTLVNNTADFNDKSGIMIEGADSDHNTIANNTCKLNDYGISLRYGDYNNLTNNTCNQNTMYGIRLYQLSDDNEITDNTAISNAKYGIYISYSNNNLIYNNYFNNTNNAYDDGNNLWNTTKTTGTNIICGSYLGGNYWSDYNGEDTDEDGVGDTLLPYNTGITNGGDWLPLTRTNVSVETSTGTGTATFSTDSGQFADINGVDEGSLPQEAIDNKPEGLTLPHGLFNFTITGLTPGQSVTLTITLPSPVPVGREWWKVNTTAGNNTWYSLPIGDDDGDNVVTITLTDGGLGDIDGAANGVIVDPSGIGEVVLPDLVIFDKWVNWPDNCTICYNVTNTGNGTASAGHNTSLYVDGVEMAHEYVPVELAPGENYTGCFDGYIWAYTAPSDNITVCADCNNTVAESNETNNCIYNTWMCGDVNEDGTVNVLDVLGVYRRALDPNYPLELPWAADVNGDGTINVLDVLGVYRRALDPGYDLGCCCE